MKVLVTGANGFVGRHLCNTLERAGHTVLRLTRSSGLAGHLTVGEMHRDTDWSPALAARPDTVVHLAARVHVMEADNARSDALFRETNTLATLNLARQCAAAGVRRFVFISTVKVQGEGRNTPYTTNDAPLPEDAYGRSKWEAEQGLQEIARETGMELTILRPPLIYGPGVDANFLRLLRAVDRGIPLPLGSIDNRRSMVFVGNFCDLILHCLVHPAAAGRTWLVSDGEDLSTPELIRRMATALDRPARLIALPVGILVWLGRLLGKSSTIDRLLGSLSVDSRAARRELAWTPPFSTQEGLRVTAAWYRDSRR